MKNVIATVPRGKDFFPRTKLLNRLYNRLNSGDHIYLSAPRRTGKTAIMYYLIDNPKDDFQFVYFNSDAIDNSATYFIRLAETLYTFKNFPQKSILNVRKFFEKINQVEILGNKISVADKRSIDTQTYFAEFCKLLDNLDTNRKKLIIMIDEFPQAVENILKIYGDNAAVQFLQFNRTIRQSGFKNIQFIYTGSIGLPTLAEKLHAMHHINDISLFEITPMERNEAKNFLVRLLNSYKVPFESEAIELLLDRIEHYTPFYIQIAFQELYEEYENNEKTINKAMAENAYSKMTNFRNNIYFFSYQERLEKAFSENELTFATRYLNYLAINEEIDMTKTRSMAKKYNLTDNLQTILRTLSFDGYIICNEDQTVYKFSSPILKTWWKKNVVK